MGRHHRRSTHRTHHGKANDSSNRRMGEFARNLVIDEEHQAYKEGRSMSKHDDIRGNHSPVTLTNQLSGGNDYVRRWLAKTDEEANQHRSEYREARQKTPSHGDPQTYVDVDLLHPALQEELTGALAWRKRKHKSSSDSSLLEVSVGLKSQPLRRSNSESENRARKEESAHPPKKQKLELSESGISTSSFASPTAKREVFEKRARHKTREDRYEPKKKVKRRQNDEEGNRPRKKREKKGDRKKAAKKAGEDLVRKFSSKSIGQERLTIRPSQGLGLFKNGRASSPVQRRVPDLAFSEMDFLQRSSRHFASVNDDKISSKSREKERRKTARAQDEISTFFKPNKMPLQPVELNKGSKPSSTQKKYCLSGYSNREEPDFPQQHHERSQSLDLPKKPNPNFGTIGPTSDILSNSLRCSPMTNHPKNVTDSASNLSGRAMTYISWSETQTSEGAASRNLSKYGRTRPSPTPESVRRSLEKTGIFRDTGISMATRPAGASPDAHERSSNRDQRRKTPIASTNSSKDTSEHTGRIISSAGPRSREPNSPPPDSRPDVQKGGEAPNTEDCITQTEVQDEEEGRIKRKRVIVEHFDPVSGWHERPMGCAHDEAITNLATKGDIPEQSKSTPINREELAKIARIKRSSTTIPSAQMFFRRDISMAKDSVDESVEQETHKRISAGDMVNVSGSNRGPIFEAPVKILPEDPSQLSILPPRYHRVDNQLASDLARTGKGERVLAAPHRSQTKSFTANHGEITEPQIGMDSLHENNSSFLGLPVRGFSTGRDPIQTALHTKESSVAERRPYFMDQLHLQLAPYEPSNYKDHLRRTGFEELDMLARAEPTIGAEIFEYNYIPEEEDLIDLYETADDYVDSALQQVYEGVEDHCGRHDETGLWSLRSAHVDMGVGSYELEELGQESHEEHQMMEDVQSQQLFVHGHTFVEREDDYEQYSLMKGDHMQVFWRPHHQY